MGVTLLQKQGDEWVVIGYHSKRLPKSAKNFGVTELELTGLLMNISSIYHRHIEHFFAFFAGNNVFSLVSESPR